MPVEIREITVSLTLLDEETGGSGGRRSPEAGEGRETEARTLVDQCVKDVLRILKDKGEA